MSINKINKSYGSDHLESEVLNASPHRLVQMLLEGAISNLSKAKGHIERKEFFEKGREISTAMSIISTLQLSLDHDASPELANTLDTLYDHMFGKLQEANINNDIKSIDEVVDLIKEIKSGWDAIGN